MTTLKYKTVKFVELRHWNEFVEQVYGRPYNLQQQDGCLPRGTISFTVPDGDCGHENDTIDEFLSDEGGVSLAGWLARDPTQFIPTVKSDEEWRTKMWWERNFYPMLEEVATDMYTKGLLEQGEYVINIDW